jgi:hypothetical protein
VTVHTTSISRANRRSLGRNIARAELVLEAMRAGAVLHAQHTRSGTIWTLTTGQRAAEEVAGLVVNSASVVGLGDALFDGCLAQTYRWWDAEDKEGPAA